MNELLLNNKEINTYRVTQIIACQLEISDIQTPAMERGTKIHETLENELFLELGNPTLWTSSLLQKEKYEVQSLEKRTDRIFEKDGLSFYISGKYDFIAKKNDGLIIGDLKTGGEYKEKHKAQLGAYMWVNGLEYNKDVYGCIFYEDLKKRVTYTRKECLDAWNEALSKFLEKLKKPLLEPNKIDSLSPTLKHYANLKIEEKQLKEALEAVKKEVEREVKNAGGELKTDSFTFAIRKRVSGGEPDFIKSEKENLMAFLKEKGAYSNFFEETSKKETEYLDFRFLN